MDTTRCDNCSCPLEPMTPQEEAEALIEAAALFGAVPPEDERSVLCDDCFKIFLPWARERGLTVEGGDAQAS